MIPKQHYISKHRIAESAVNRAFSAIGFCIIFGGYIDDEKNGKDITHRPAFMQMMSDARNGEIKRIVVKKYDRFSRNIREYLNITDELDKLGVSVYSLSEPFNTETKEGRMMRNNLLNFAEFERETIAADAYNTIARETGFYQGGKMYYGYDSERKISDVLKSTNSVRLLLH